MHAPKLAHEHSVGLVYEHSVHLSDLVVTREVAEDTPGGGRLPASMWAMIDVPATAREGTRRLHATHQSLVCIIWWV
jgi:hypothetical protein